MIKVGDLVVAVKPSPCCGSQATIGVIFRVDYIKDGPNSCRHCGRMFANSLDAWFRGSDTSWAVEVLKKIPPLSDLEGQKDSSGLDERHEFYEALRKMAEGLRS